MPGTLSLLPFKAREPLTEQDLENGTDPRRWKILAVLTGALFMSLVGVSIVNVALPSIQDGLGATESELQWVLSGYALTFGVLLVAAGRAGDVYGRGPIFITGVAIFTLSSVASGFATDALTLNISRALQGVGSGLLNPQGVGAIQQYFKGAERAKAFGIFGAAVGVSVAIGPVLGGLLIDAFGPEMGWRWTFFVNVPVGLVTIVLAVLWFPKPMLKRPDPDDTAGKDDLDPIGAVILALAVFFLLLPFMESKENPLLWFGLLAGAGLTGLWLWWERRHKQRGGTPMVDLDIFRTPSFANGTLLITLYFMGMTSIWVIVALYMQDGLGHSALASGLVGLPSAVCSTLAALWGGRNVTAYGRYVVIGGMYFALTGIATSSLVVWLHHHGLVSEWWLLLTLSLIGIGQGTVISPNQALTLADVPIRYAGSSGGIMQTGQRIGTSAGIALITAMTFAVLSKSGWTVAFIIGFSGVFAIISISLAVAYKDLRQRRLNPLAES